MALAATALTTSPAIAKRGEGVLTLNRYVEARLAELSEQPEVATAIYSESLKEQPDNGLFARKAYVKAIETGNFDLALKAVRLLDLQGRIDAEMPLVLFADGFARRDWRTSETALLELESLKNFAFLLPYLKAWMATARGGDSIEYLNDAESDATAKFYLDEQLALLQLAQNNHGTAASIDEIVSRDDPRMAPVRILAARHYLAGNDISRAIAVLASNRTGPEARLSKAIEADSEKKYSRKIDAQSGVAFLFHRLSSDLGAQRATFLSLVTAQIAARISPENDYGHLILGQAYQKIENSKLANRQLARVSENSPYFLVALNSEILNQIEAKQFDAAISRLDQRIAGEGATPELRFLKGQVFQVSGQHKQAADAFSEAISLAENKNYPDHILASYWLSLGGAQEQAGIWPQGLKSLERANELRPNTASILNYLGYAQLEQIGRAHV